MTWGAQRHTRALQLCACPTDASGAVASGAAAASTSAAGAGAGAAPRGPGPQERLHHRQRVVHALPPEAVPCARELRQPRACGAAGGGPRGRHAASRHSGRCAAGRSAPSGARSGRGAVQARRQGCAARRGCAPGMWAASLVEALAGTSTSSLPVICGAGAPGKSSRVAALGCSCDSLAPAVLGRGRKQCRCAAGLTSSTGTRVLPSARQLDQSQGRMARQMPVGGTGGEVGASRAGPMRCRPAPAAARGQAGQQSQQCRSTRGARRQPRQPSASSPCDWRRLVSGLGSSAGMRRLSVIHRQAPLRPEGVDVSQLRGTLWGRGGGAAGRSARRACQPPHARTPSMQRHSTRAPRGQATPAH